MKKIALVFISVLLLAFLAGCNGEVDNLLWDGKTITLITNKGSFDSEDTTKDSIKLTVPYETWEEWSLDGRTINIYITNHDSVYYVIDYGDLYYFFNGGEGIFMVKDSNNNQVSRNDSIANGGTYYLMANEG